MNGKGPGGVRPTGPDNLRPTGPDNLRPSGPDNLRPSGPDNLRPSGPTTWISFYRAQISSAIASVVDFSTTIFFVEILHFWYVLATATGALVGAVVNFCLGRHWSFEATKGEAKSQAIRYAIVSSGSLVLNSCGVAFLTEVFGIKYWISKLITAFIVGIVYNFTLQRKFVFQKKAQADTKAK